MVQQSASKLVVVACFLIFLQIVIVMIEFIYELMKKDFSSFCCFHLFEKEHVLQLDVVFLQPGGEQADVGPGHSAVQCSAVQ